MEINFSFSNTEEHNPHGYKRKEEERKYFFPAFWLVPNHLQVRRQTPRSAEAGGAAAATVERDGDDSRPVGSHLHICQFR